MRRFTAFTIMILFFLPIVSAWLWRQYEIKCVRWERKANWMETLSEEQLVALAFHNKSLPDLEFHHHWYEFEWQGKMYDVVRMEETSDSTLFYCLPDNRETAVRQTFERDFLGWLHKAPQEQSKNDRVASFFKFLFFEQLKNEHITVADCQQGQASMEVQRALQSARILLWSPPPELG